MRFSTILCAALKAISSYSIWQTECSDTTNEFLGLQSLDSLLKGYLHYLGHLINSQFIKWYRFIGDGCRAEATKVDLSLKFSLFWLEELASKWTLSAISCMDKLSVSIFVTTSARFISKFSRLGIMQNSTVQRVDFEFELQIRWKRLF